MISLQEMLSSSENYYSFYRSDLNYDAGDITINLAPILGLIFIIYILRVSKYLFFTYSMLPTEFEPRLLPLVASKSTDCYALLPTNFHINQCKSIKIRRITVF